MLDWDASDIKTWKEEAWMLQQDIFLHLGDKEWDAWDISDTVILYRKIGYGLYSLPENTPEENNPTGYNEEQIHKIKCVADFILKNAKNDKMINFACIFVFVKIYEERYFTPVFKVKGKQNQTIFVDSDCRIYKNWQDYLNSNHLPKCLYCYPRDGLYQGDMNKVLVDFRTSPICSLKNDSTLTMENFSPTSMMPASLFTLPIAISNLTEVQTTSANTEVYLVTQQNVNIGNSQSRNPKESKASTNWLEFLGCALSIAQNCLGTNIARSTAAGNVPTKVMRLAHDVVTVGSLTVNGLVTLNNLISLVDKASKGSLTSLDTFRFSASLLFFSNSLLHADTAEELIETIQQHVLNQHCEDLTAQQIEELFRLLEVIGNTEMHKNANRIKALKHIPDKQAFFESLVNLRSDLEDHEVKFSFKELGLININNELHIAPTKLLQISEADRQMILEATQKLKDSTEKDTVYWKKIEKTLQNNRIKMEFQRRIAIQQLKLAFNTHSLNTVKIGNEQIFKDMTPYELDRLATVMMTSGKNYDPKILKIVNEFAKRRCCKTVYDYCNYLEITVKYLEELKNKKEGDYQEALADAQSKGNVNTNTFNRNYGIEGKRAVHFRNQVYNDFDANWEESFKDLDKLYAKLENRVLPLNENIEPKFALNSSAIYHYYKHSKFNSKDLTAEEYFNIASELVNEPINQRSAQLNQQGNRTMIVLTNPINGGKGIVVEALGDGSRYMVTFFYDEKVIQQAQSGNTKE
ncbi:uncharacterized protein LOC129971115 [Argiope bruennichi]|uniref:uncharacterized protein LOC129971115 n=1 Tax=Argiope bruennichi TaxID=94029 RepID=UPI0024947085|nr:uncharacterized protein LOC129971115 [Argiope bruennichi]XP_055940576.1 uncharacterized protein LOC129971115 [Argiope bruennichi]